MKKYYIFQYGIMTILLIALLSGCNKATREHSMKNSEITTEQLTPSTEKSAEVSSENQISQVYQEYKNYLQTIQKKADQLEQEIHNEDLPQQQLNLKSYELYELWDNELNDLWKQLKDTLDPMTMKKLTEEQKQWIKKKEEEVKKAGEEFEGGSMQPMIKYGTAQSLTKQRVYKLAEYLK